MDSDRKYPNMPLESGKQNLINYLKQNEIDFHILEKREMENYLPDEVLSELEDNDGYIKAYLNLSPVQKDFFDIEKGFPDKNFNSLFHNIQQLYEDINDDNYKILRKNTINYNDFKNEFPKLFVFSQKVTQQSLLERTKHQQNPNELQDILKRITKLL